MVHNRKEIMFPNGPGDRVSIPGRVIPKTQKMVLDASLLNSQHYKVRIKGKVEQSREWSSALPYTSVWFLGFSQLYLVTKYCDVDKKKGTQHR